MSNNIAETRTSSIGEDYLREHDVEIRKLVRSAARRLPAKASFVNQVMDELINEVRLKVWRYFDESRGSLPTFVYRCTKTVLWNMWEQTYEHSKKTYNILDHGDADENPLLERHIACDGGIDDVVHAVWVQSLQNEKMTDRQAEVFGLMNSGCRNGDISEEIGVNTQRVSQLRQAVAKVVEKDILEAAGQLSYAMGGA